MVLEVLMMILRRLRWWGKDSGADDDATKGRPPSLPTRLLGMFFWGGGFQAMGDRLTISRILKVGDLAVETDNGEIQNEGSKAGRW